MCRYFLLLSHRQGSWLALPPLRNPSSNSFGVSFDVIRKSGHHRNVGDCFSVADLGPRRATLNTHPMLTGLSADLIIADAIMITTTARNSFVYVTLLCYLRTCRGCRRRLPPPTARFSPASWTI